MACSFVVYIDESGDQGFTFRQPAPAGSSHWFILGALVVRRENDLQCVETMRRIRKAMGRQPNAHIHWRRLKHDDKVYFAQELSKMPVRLIAVCVHKPSLQDVSTFQRNDLLYFYAVRYLLERVSWLVRDTIPTQGDGTAQLVFSKRKRMSYDNLFCYLKRLEQSAKYGADIRIHFPSFCLNRKRDIKVFEPQKRAGLQLVDGWAGAVWNSLEQNKYGNREPRYAHILSPVLYRYHDTAMSYGVKIMPKEAIAFVEREVRLGRIYPWWQKT